MPSCNLCSQKIGFGRYVVSAGQNFHPNCYQIVAPKCSVCSRVLAGSFRVDFWKNQYCVSCYHTVPECSTCKRLISKSHTNGGMRYGDGRTICSICHATAVTTDAQVKAVLLDTTSILQSFGLILNPDILTIYLQEANKTDRNSGVVLSETKPGIMRCQESLVNGALHQRQFNIFILTGLPKIHFMGTLGHELFHVVSRLRGYRLPPAWEEGVANLVQYLVLQRFHDRPEAKYLIHNLLHSPDPIYGDGFRMTKARSEAMGLDRFWAWLRFQ